MKYTFCNQCGTVRELPKQFGSFSVCCDIATPIEPLLREEALARQSLWLEAYKKSRARLTTRGEKIETLKKYLLLKVEQSDWHAVSDAANDIRVLEGK